MSINNDDQSNSTIVLNNLTQLREQEKQQLFKLNACLLGLDGATSGTIVDLPAGTTSFGRSQENTISLTADGISRKHFAIEISPDGQQATLKDLGSSNGTYVNDRKVEEKTLQKNDRITLGMTSFRFIPKGDPDRLAYDKMALAANTDQLTQCFNKAYFMQALDNEVKQAQRLGQPLSLIIFDLDFFKKLNDTYGHLAGDCVLREVARSIRQSGVRDGDVFARYGGEEFVILLPKTNIKQGHDIAERLRQLIEQKPIMVEGQALKVTMSVGLADYRPGVANGEELFKRADQAVYQSKHQGRNRTSFYRE